MNVGSGSIIDNLMDVFSTGPSTNNTNFNMMGGSNNSGNLLGGIDDLLGGLGGMSGSSTTQNIAPSNMGMGMGMPQ